MEKTDATQAISSVSGGEMEPIFRDLQNPSAAIVYLLFCSQARRSGGTTVSLSHQAIADATGISKSTSQKAVKFLLERSWISCKRASPTAIPEYTILGKTAHAEIPFAPPRPRTRPERKPESAPSPASGDPAHVADRPAASHPLPEKAPMPPPKLEKKKSARSPDPVPPTSGTPPTAPIRARALRFSALRLKKAKNLTHRRKRKLQARR